MSWIYVTIPFFLQALAIIVDEWVFHLRRGLPKWERIGHPLDTLSLLICLVYVLCVPFSADALKVFCLFAVISCLMVTKDEFVHKEHCPGAENWLHALLFLLHPITLACTGVIWPVIDGAPVPSWITVWLDNQAALKTFLLLQAIAIAIFLLYQIIFWNFLWKNRPVLKQ